MPKMPRRPRSDGAIRIRGFFRVNLVEEDVDGSPRIVGDSGWTDNVITLAGLKAFVGDAMAAQAGSSQVFRAGIGSGTQPATNATALDGELAHAAASSNNRATSPTLNTATTGAGSNSYNYSFVWSFLSTKSFITAVTTVANIGMFANSNAGGTMFCGATFASSTISMNQDLLATYVVRIG